MKLPNLIVAGLPKAGSSSLFHWLAAHPEVYGAPSKETFYFIDRDSPLLRLEANYNFHGLDLYESFFSNCPDDAKIVLEATPHYIYQKTALDFFASCNPQPHVVFLLRKPSKRIFSAFSFMQNNLARLDSNLTFEQITDLLLDQTGNLVQKLDYPQDSIFYEWLNDQLPHNRYYDFLTCWSERFSNDKIHIILFEEMIANPQATLIKLAESLGIDANFYKEFYFEQRTKTIVIKNRFAHEMLLKLAPYIATSKIRGLLKSLYIQLNSSAPKPATSESLTRLDNYFQPYNQKLAEEFNLNLESWK
ncbi:sulfotransferase [Pleurocapsa sp. PCC 7319]|uniref:sulfotransferase family protein n=1 Tax=Pleurocapsa sp. PCC 7319 TaxID=118161 RepID=UPI00034D4569|nr:sulfotransferase [Pleurocapsa sp. PCC 7319]